MAMVEVKNVRKVYRRDTQEVPVLDGLSITIDEGDFVGLMGPSGSGKTTLLNLIGGIDRPTSGELVVGNQNIAQLNGQALAKWRSRNIGYIFQLYNLIPVLTAQQNVALPLLLHKMNDGAALTRQERAGDRRARRPGPHFPRQLGWAGVAVAIARAIVSNRACCSRTNPRAISIVSRARKF
jgi:putative ABC transport system ATP-binding protein